MKQALTKREKEILLLVLQELSSEEISRKLDLSLQTINTHRKNILRKTGCKGTIGLVKYAIRKDMMKDFTYRENIKTKKPAEKGRGV